MRRSGFTLLETVMTVAAIGIIAGLSMPLFVRIQQRSELDVATSAVVSSLRRARLLSEAMNGDSTWGTKVLSGSVVTFRGTSYATRATAADETFAIASGIAVSGLNEVVFSKLTGEPQQTGSISLTFGSESRSVSVAAKGVINY